MTSQSCVMAGAARYQPAHAVADDDQFFHRHRPFRDQGFQQAGKLAPVARNVAAAVVMQIDRCVAKIAGQRRTVVVIFAIPLQIIHAQAMRKHQQLAAGLDQHF